MENIRQITILFVFAKRVFVRDCELFCNFTFHRFFHCPSDMNFFSLSFSSLAYTALSLIVCALYTIVPVSLSAQNRSQYINHTGFLTIDGKQTHSYTIQFSHNGDTTRRVTSYFDTSQKLIRKETTVFRASPLALFSNTIDDYRTGEYLRQELHGNRFITRRRERKGEEIKEKSVSAENAIVATLVSERARQSIEAIDKGLDVKFTLALPAMGIVTEMQFVKAENRTIQGVPCVRVKLEPSNFILKAMMGDPSYFTIERATPHRFMHYEGILGLPSDEGKQQSGFVAMRY
jgi:hypothetical protein